MRNFLYLRLVATVTLVTLVSYMVYFPSRYSPLILRLDWMMFALNEGVFALFITNSLSVLFIYYRYYPQKEISKVSIRFYWISFVIAILWACSMVFIFFAMLIYEKLGKDDGLAGNERHVQMWLSLAIAGLLVVQLIGGRRMIKTIRKNARAQLENSFA